MLRSVVWRFVIWPTHWLEWSQWVTTDPEKQRQIRRALDDQAKRRRGRREAEQACARAAAVEGIPEPVNGRSAPRAPRPSRTTPARPRSHRR